MLFRFGSKEGATVPSLPRTLDDIQARLRDQQAAWAEQLARDPASLAQLEVQVHHAFGQLADRMVAGLLAHAAAQPALAEHAKKK